MLCRWQMALSAKFSSVTMAQKRQYQTRLHWRGKLKISTINFRQLFTSLAGWISLLCKVKKKGMDTFLKSKILLIFKLMKNDLKKFLIKLVDNIFILKSSIWFFNNFLTTFHPLKLIHDKFIIYKFPHYLSYILK